jgi:hypothetical protein
MEYTSCSMAGNPLRAQPRGPEGPWTHAVCFASYENFVENRLKVTADGNVLGLRSFMPTAAEARPGEVCFLEVLSNKKPSWPPSLGVRSYLLGREDILAPSFSADDSAKEAPGDEYTFKLREPIRSSSFLRLSNDQPPRPQLPCLKIDADWLGPRLAEETDEIKLRIEGSSLFRASSASATDKYFECLNSVGVLRISPAQHARPRNATTSWVIQSNEEDNRPLFDKNLKGKDQIIGLIDEFLDPDHCFFKDTENFGGKHRKLVRFEPSPTSKDLHGTFTAGIAAGMPKPDPGNFNHGQAPEAKLAFDWLYSFSAEGEVDTTFSTVLKAQYNALARIFSNSWGYDKDQSYSLWAHDLDSFLYDNPDALAVFSTSNEGRIGSPDNARNALAVGASFQWELQDQKGRGADGPTEDGRRKPEILAPGCLIYSSRPAESSAVAHASGAASNCETGLPPTMTTPDGIETTCATSWAAPAVAGAAALIRQAIGAAPSGALLKALLLNSTVDMTGVVGKLGEPYPNEREGWGRIVLSNVIPLRQGGRNTLVYDVAKDDGLTTKPQPDVDTYWFRVSSGRPLKVTLVWTDPAPAVTEKKTPVVNDLDLRIERLQCPSSQACWFLGNDFQQGFSPPRKKPSGASPDTQNNVEQILIEKPDDAVYAVSIVGTKVLVSLQGYALVVSGKAESCADPSCP